MRNLARWIFTGMLLVGAIGRACAQNPPTNYTPQTTPYGGTESWYCEVVTGTLNRRCSATDLIGSINSIRPGAATISTPADPTGTTSSTGVMMGLAGTITPTRSGKVMVTIYGSGQADTSGGQCAMSIRTGTGSAPANGAAVSGTAVGTAVQGMSANANTPWPYTLSVVVTGLTLSTARWIDLVLTSNGTVQCNIFSNTVTAGEL